MGSNTTLRELSFKDCSLCDDAAPALAQLVTQSQHLHILGKTLRGLFLGLARTIYIRCIYSIFGREITEYTVYIYGVHILFLCRCPEGRTLF
jgi:hypothetical protein